MRRGASSRSRFWTFAHDAAQCLVTDAADLDMTRRVDVVIQPFQREAVEIDEISRHMHAGDEALGTAFDRPEDEAVDQDRASVRPRASLEQAGAIVMFLHRFDQIFDINQIVGAKVASQPAGEKIPRVRILVRCLVPPRRVHGGANREIVPIVH